MRFTSALDIKLARLLRSENFKKKGNVFLRIHGDGIMQCVFSIKEPFSKISIKNGLTKPSISVSIHSIYEPNVFRDPKIYRGALTYPFSLKDFNFEKKVYYSQLELFAESCLPKLNETTSQDLFCELITSLDMARYGKVRWYIDMLTIPSLMALGEYTRALEICDNVLSNNSTLTHVMQMKELLLCGNNDAIYDFLTNNQKQNYETYQIMRFH